MATITIRINERTSVGKAILQLLRANKEDVEILHYPNEETIKAMNDAKKGKGMTRVKSFKEYKEATK